MKKFIFALLAVLLIAGVAFAVSIPQSEESKNGPYVWTVPVYNNSGSTLDVGDVVIWDIDASTGDNDNYVTTTTTADTHIVAGVVYSADIAAGDTGTIVVRGVVATDCINLQTVNGPACSSGTAGTATSCSDDDAMFGHVTQVCSSGSALIMVE